MKTAQTERKISQRVIGIENLYRNARLKFFRLIVLVPRSFCFDQIKFNGILVTLKGFLFLLKSFLETTKI